MTRMKTDSTRETVIAIISIFTVPALNSLYTILNSEHEKYYKLITPLDLRIPFIRQFIIPYNLWYPFILSSLLYLCLKSRKIYYKTIIAIDMGLICCYIIYILFQTTVPRPLVTGSDIFSVFLRFTYSVDQPYNCFPSIHVLVSYLLVKGYKKSEVKSKAIRGFIYLMAVTIIFSTMFVKQHVILDVAAGIVLGDVVFFLAQHINEERIIGWIKKRFSSWTMKRKLGT